MIQDVITIALVCNEEVMLIHAYISSLKGEVLRGDDKSWPPYRPIEVAKTPIDIQLVLVDASSVGRIDAFVLDVQITGHGPQNHSASNPYPDRFLWRFQ